MPNAVYIHIPFCEQICHYCDFNKLLIERQPVDDYLSYLELEMKNTIQKFPFDKIDSIYIGGGTPTSLNTYQMEKLLETVQKFFGSNIVNIEYTVEANPSVTDREKLAILKKYGVNRLSIGVQAFQDDLLASINRNHRESDIKVMIAHARELGFENISIDLMFGLPNQTLSMFKESIEKAISLQTEHISAYSLQVEPKTVFYIRQQKGKLKLPAQELEAEMFQVLIDEMKRNNFNQYEISNFSNTNYESKHNLTYWYNQEYYGFGAGAHSYLQNKRIANAGPLKKYMSLLDQSGLPHVTTHLVTTSESMEEEMFLGLRKLKGVSKKVFKEKYGEELESVFAEQVIKLQARDLLVDDGEFVKLTGKGIFLGNEVFQEFIGVI
jgi:oxygen-independent coproporphyrinogen-3 oxidase